MIALFIAGVFIAFAFTFVLAAGFFTAAWRQHRRDVEYLLFGLATLALAAYTAGAAVMYGVSATGAVWPTIRGLADFCEVSSTVSVPLLLHFALRYTRSGAERRVMNVAYATAAVYLVAVAAGVFWEAVPESFLSMHVWGVALPKVALELTPLGACFYALTMVAVLAVPALLLQAYRRGESGALVIGAVFLTLTIINDALALGAGLYASISIAPVGYTVFVYSVGVTLVDRYGGLSAALEGRTRELDQRSDELARSLGELSLAREELVRSEQLAVVGEFAAVITHEVRNPMAIVNNAVSTLRRADAASDDTRGLLAIIEDEMARLDRLVTLLLNYARPVVPQRAPRDLIEILEQSLVPIADMPEIDLDVQCDVASPTLHVDAELMRQAFDNVIINAVQAMDGRGDLRVRVAQRVIDDVDCIVVGVEDTGEGMTEHQLEQALSPFYTTRPSGAGLGLAICDRIVESHGGGLVISSELGVGTAVSVILPIHPDERVHGSSDVRTSARFELVIN